VSARIRSAVDSRKVGLILGMGTDATEPRGKYRCCQYHALFGSISARRCQRATTPMQLGQADLGLIGDMRFIDHFVRALCPANDELLMRCYTQKQRDSDTRR
jgi:hypothetical protein